LGFSAVGMARWGRRGCFAAVDGASSAAPADSAEPGSRGGDGAGGGGTGWRVRPAFEPRSGAVMVDGGESAEVLAEVEQHIHEGEAHLARCSKGAGVIAPAPDRPASAAGAVDGAGAADGQALQTADQRRGRVCLDDEVQVISLHGELNHAKRLPARFCERAGEPAVHRYGPERRYAESGAERDVDGVPRIVPGRGLCGGPGRSFAGLRPAPLRRPPQVEGTGRSSCLERRRAILIWQ
jgi:hypothetical protein